MSSQKHISHTGEVEPEPCPFCGDEIKNLPSHLRHHCEEKP